MIENLAILAIIWVAMSAIYVFKNRTSTGKEEDYVWVGKGIHPFKK